MVGSMSIGQVALAASATWPALQPLAEQAAENDREPLAGLSYRLSSGGGGNRTRVHGRDRKGFSKLSLRSYLAAEHHAGRCSTGQSGVGVPCSRHGPPGYQASLLLKDTLRGGPEGPPVT